MINTFSLLTYNGASAIFQSLERLNLAIRPVGSTWRRGRRCWRGTLRSSRWCLRRRGSCFLSCIYKLDGSHGHWRRPSRAVGNSRRTASRIRGFHRHLLAPELQTSCMGIHISPIPSHYSRHRSFSTTCSCSRSIVRTMQHSQREWPFYRLHALQLYPYCSHQGHRFRTRKYQMSL